MNIRKVLSVVLLASMLTSPIAWAASRSVSVRISCTILPSLQVSSPSQSQLTAKSLLRNEAGNTRRPELGVASSGDQIIVGGSLGNQYRIQEKFLKIKEDNIKLYSITAL